MPTEDDLKRALAGAEAPNTLDATRVIARSRRRRLPRQLGAGAAGVLVLAGVGVLAINTSLLQNTAGGTSDEAMIAESEAAPDTAPDEMDQSQLAREPITLAACGSPLPEPQSQDPSSGLELELIVASENSAAPDSIPVTLRITNTSSDRVTGVTGVPIVALARDGVIVAHSGGAVDLIAIDVTLQPGQSTEINGAVYARECLPGAENDISTAPDTQPALAAGSYVIASVASINFYRADGNLASSTDLLATAPVLLR